MSHITELEKLREEERSRPVPLELAYLETRVKAKAAGRAPCRSKKRVLAALSLCLILGTAMAWGLGGFEHIERMMGKEAQQLLPYYQPTDLSVELEHIRVDVEGIIFTTHSSTVLFQMTALDETGRTELNDPLPPFFLGLAEGEIGTAEEPFDSFHAPWREGRDLEVHISWLEWLEDETADSTYGLFTTSVEEMLAEGMGQTLLLYFPGAVNGVPEKNGTPGGTLLTFPVETVLEEKQIQMQDRGEFRAASVSPALVTIQTALSGEGHRGNWPLFDTDPVVTLVYQDGTRWSLKREHVMERGAYPPYISSVSADGTVSLLYFLQQAPPELGNLTGLEVNGVFCPIE